MANSQIPGDRLGNGEAVPVNFSARSMKKSVAGSVVAGIAAGCFTMFGILGLDSATTGWVQLDNIRLPNYSTEVVIYRNISHLYNVDSNYIVLSTDEEEFLLWIDRLGLTPVPEEKIFAEGVTEFYPHESLKELWKHRSDEPPATHYHGTYRNHRVSALHSSGRAFIVAHRIWN